MKPPELALDRDLLGDIKTRVRQRSEKRSYSDTSRNTAG